MQAQGPHHALHGLHLARQGLGHGHAIGLVVRVDLVAEILAVAVLEKGKPAGPFLAQDAQQDAGDHGQGAGRKAVGALQRAVRIKASVQIGCAVHEEDGTVG